MFSSRLPGRNVEYVGSQIIPSQSSLSGLSGRSNLDVQKMDRPDKPGDDCTERKEIAEEGTRLSKVEGDVEARSGVGDSAGRNIVHAGRCNSPHGCDRDVS